MSTVVSAQQILATVPKHEQRQAQANGSREAFVSTAPGAPTVEQILTTAEASTFTRTRRAAAKIRQQIDALREQIKAESREQVAARRVADLRRQLDEANAALWRIRRGTEDGPRPWQVREWAKANGVNCTPKGRVPKAVMAAYLAAQSGGA